MSVFSKNNLPVKNVNRNTFDLSFQNNITMKMGNIYPCFVKEVLPGDTFEINTAFGLRFMPLAFPIQTKIRADVHYFYVRNRNLWKDFPDFYGSTQDGLIPPFLTGNTLVNQFNTGSLGDYLGLPTTKITNNVLPSYNIGVISKPGLTQTSFVLTYDNDSDGNFDSIREYSFDGNLNFNSFNTKPYEQGRYYLVNGNSGITLLMPKFLQAQNITMGTSITVKYPTIPFAHKVYLLFKDAQSKPIDQEYTDVVRIGLSVNPANLIQLLLLIIIKTLILKM